jgi:hypothetical protein
VPKVEHADKLCKMRNTIVDVNMVPQIDASLVLYLLIWTEPSWKYEGSLAYRTLLNDTFFRDRYLALGSFNDAFSAE